MKKILILSGIPILLLLFCLLPKKETEPLKIEKGNFSITLGESVSLAAKDYFKRKDLPHFDISLRYKKGEEYVEIAKPEEGSYKPLTCGDYLLVYSYPKGEYGVFFSVEEEQIPEIQRTEMNVSSYHLSFPEQIHMKEQEELSFISFETFKEEEEEAETPPAHCIMEEQYCLW